MDVKNITFLSASTMVASAGAWWCFNRLAAADDTGSFRYIFHGIDQENWPGLFAVLKGFLNIQAYGFLLLAGIGVIWLTAVMIGKVK